MDLLDDDMGIWLLIFYYTLSGLLRTDIEFLMIFLLIGYAPGYTQYGRIAHIAVVAIVVASFPFLFIPLYIGQLIEFLLQDILFVFVPFRNL